MKQVRFVEAPNNFYLGARVDPTTNEMVEDQPVYYDARDLTTHGVILGMTGSGKTGLGITLLEEAAIDGIPQLILDPKGDITNMLLAFPDMTAEHFEPWVNSKDAMRNDMEIGQYAQTVAEQWKEGLAMWSITPERIQEYRRSAQFSIYTPGSSAGLSLSILASFAAPMEGWAGNEESLRERIAGIVTAILGLAGIDANPVEDPEHILLSNIFEYNWRNGSDLSMEQLILQVQNPPFSKLGVLDVETVIPEKDRFKLAKQLNNIIASPNFQSWTQGDPIHIPSLLYTSEGYPRSSIIYTAHLNDAERQFITTLLLESVLSWMRTLSGTASLRALVYIDEVYGMFPPHPYNPPTKDPIMRLLKQARAFGIGMLVSTQNPKDIDYKGLSNIGTWWIGKLQTDNDKQRVLEGLNTVSEADNTINIARVDKLISQLKPREFIMHNVHEAESPILMNTRWTMSYLRGPLTRQQIGDLMANQKENSQPAAPSKPASVMGAQTHPASEMAGRMGGVIQPRAAMPSTQSAPASQPEAPAAEVKPTYQVKDEESRLPPGGSSGGVAQQESDVPPGFSPGQPRLGTSISQYFLPVEYTVEQSVRNWEQWTGQVVQDLRSNKRLLYRASLLAELTVRFQHKQSSSMDLLWYAFIMPKLPAVPYVNWEEFQAEPFDPAAMEPQPFSEAYYADLPQTLIAGSGFKDLGDNLVDWIYHNASLTVLHAPMLDMYSALNEDSRDFYARVQAQARQLRDEEVDQVAGKYDTKLDNIEDQIRKKQSRLESERDELQARKQEELLTMGETVYRLMKGSAYQTISRAGRLRRYTSQSGDRIDLMEQDVAMLLEDLDKTEYEMQGALQKVQDKWEKAVSKIEEVPITPYKKDITMVLFGIGWVPYWDVVLNNNTMILPASSSGLTTMQQPGSYGGGGGW